VIVKQGEIYFAYVNAPEAHRVVVVSRDELNGGDYVVVVPFTTKRLARRKSLRNCVFFPRGTLGLSADCVAQTEAITAAPKENLDLDTGPLGTLNAEQMRDIIRATGYVLGAICEPE
jgi:mRNA-degrading endonuclease toxin of MazEF toxin-antitoxin module